MRRFSTTLTRSRKPKVCTETLLIGGSQLASFPGFTYAVLLVLSSVLLCSFRGAPYPPVVTMYPPIGPNFTWSTPFILGKDRIFKSCRVQYITQEYHIDISIHCKKMRGDLFFRVRRASVRMYPLLQTSGENTGTETKVQRKARSGY